MVKLDGFEDFMISELSGGMKKRAALARALALDPGILFFDEPSAGLDPITSAELDELIVQINQSLGTTIVVVSHELPSIFTIADRVHHARRRDQERSSPKGRRRSCATSSPTRACTPSSTASRRSSAQRQEDEQMATEARKLRVGIFVIAADRHRHRRRDLARRQPLSGRRDAGRRPTSPSRCRASTPARR